MKKKSVLFIMLIAAGLFLMTGCPKPDKCKEGEVSEKCPPPPPPPPPGPIEPPNDDFMPNFPDGSFENGFGDATDYGSSYQDYSSDLIHTLNMLSVYADENNPDGGPLTAVKIDNPKELPVDYLWALKLTTKRMLFGTENLFIPGAVGTISENFIDEFIRTNGKIGTTVPFTGRPIALKGYYKYSPVQGDSAAVEIELYDGNVSIGRGLMIKKQAVNQWTMFEVPITYNLPQNPTHIKLIVASSAGYNFDDLTKCMGRENSTLWIDRFWWKY